MPSSRTPTRPPRAISMELRPVRGSIDQTFGPGKEFGETRYIRIKNSGEALRPINHEFGFGSAENLRIPAQAPPTTTPSVYGMFRSRVKESPARGRVSRSGPKYITPTPCRDVPARRRGRER